MKKLIMTCLLCLTLSSCSWGQADQQANNPNQQKEQVPNQTKTPAKPEISQSNFSALYLDYLCKIPEIDEQKTRENLEVLLENLENNQLSQAELKQALEDNDQQQAAAAILAEYELNEDQFLRARDYYVDLDFLKIMEQQVQENCPQKMPRFEKLMQQIISNAANDSSLQKEPID
jgi:hypothetical protein